MLRTADEAARRFDPDARVRLVPDGTAACGSSSPTDPGPATTIVEHEAGFTLFVAPGLSGTVDVAEPHDRLVLIADDEGADT